MLKTSRQELNFLLKIFEDTPEEDIEKYINSELLYEPVTKNYHTYFKYDYYSSLIRKNLPSSFKLVTFMAGSTKISCFFNLKSGELFFPIPNIYTLSGRLKKERNYLRLFVMKYNGSSVKPFYDEDTDLFGYSDLDKKINEYVGELDSQITGIHFICLENELMNIPIISIREYQIFPSKPFLVENIILKEDFDNDPISNPDNTDNDYPDTSNGIKFKKIEKKGKGK
ncbi:hypothetical protein M3M35_04700 [Fructilactobacillus myrtifloralis]|uniref:Uncharacterized protein n=1 Tax=Fructilactobacillus myrtifloralis TaxID=2940301 RepID=A0ABY5BLR4_9LACO|nr:hypothetical protein [Fructilactobacillus myrtifloralis]USS84615.1 hypothetical protein M3M35_04700 [Fructilactobacillus myrtifloralis]